MIKTLRHLDYEKYSAEKDNGCDRPTDHLSRNHETLLCIVLTHLSGVKKLWDTGIDQCQLECLAAFVCYLSTSKFGISQKCN